MPSGTVLSMEGILLTLNTHSIGTTQLEGPPAPYNEDERQRGLVVHHS